MASSLLTGTHQHDTIPQKWTMVNVPSHDDIVVADVIDRGGRDFCVKRECNLHEAAVLIPAD